MGPVKAALESSVSCLAAELGAKQIRVHAISPGPMRTRAASGLSHFDELLQKVVREAPEHRLASKEDVAATVAFLVSDNARTLTGNLIYVDAGYHIVG
jgi:enoyl-[acyl-carrier protein] reductase I